MSDYGRSKDTQKRMQDVLGPYFKSVLADPDWVAPGSELRVPDLSKHVPDALAPATHELQNQIQGIGGYLTSPAGLATAAFPPLGLVTGPDFAYQGMQDATNIVPQLGRHLAEGQYPEAGGDAVRAIGDAAMAYGGSKVAGGVPGQLGVIEDKINNGGTLHHVSGNDMMDIYRAHPDRGLIYFATTHEGARSASQIPGDLHAANEVVAKQPVRLYGDNPKTEPDAEGLAYHDKRIPPLDNSPSPLSWDAVENPDFQEFLRQNGYDGVLVHDEAGSFGTSNYGKYANNPQAGSVALLPEAVRSKIQATKVNTIDNTVSAYPRAGFHWNVKNPIADYTNLTEGPVAGNYIDMTPGLLKRIISKHLTPEHDSGDPGIMESAIRKVLEDRYQRKTKQQVQDERGQREYEEYTKKHNSEPDSTDF